MKKLMFIINQDRKADVTDLFRGIKEIENFILSDVESHGRQSDDNPQLSDRDKVVGYVPQVRVDILINDEYVDKVLATIRGSSVGLKGHASYWLMDVNSSGKL